MTKLTALLNKSNGRRPVIRPIRFYEALPLRLRDKVSGKGTGASEVSCLPEMMSMLSCFADHDYDQSYCGKEMDIFQKCHLDHLERKAVDKKKALENALVPGLKPKELTGAQANKLLRSFPQFPKPKNKV